MAEEDDKKKREKENQEQLMIALALLLYPKVDENTLSYEEIPQDVKKKLKKEIGSYVKEENVDMTNMTKSDILKTAQGISKVKSDYFEVVTVGDDKTCDNCKKWEGKIISDTDSDYPSYSDFENSGACHPNCRCYLKPISINKSMNNEPTNDETTNATENNVSVVDKTIDNGTTEVQVATIGTVIGSDTEGNPVEQHFTEESLQKIAENTTDEILVDAEHSSEKGGTTEAKGWLSKLSFIPGKGLFGKISWTDIGRKLVENRVFRWLSPSWLIDKNTKEPVAMTSVALTNKPSQMGRIEPIINNSPNEEKIIMELTKDELVSLIKDTITNMNSCSEQKDKEIVNSCQDGEDKNEVAVNEEITDTETSTTEPVTKEEPGVKTVVDKKVVEEKTEHVEVIKEEVLNNAPTIGTDISGKAEWENLHGKEFFDWYKKHSRGY